MDGKDVDFLREAQVRWQYPVDGIRTPRFPPSIGAQHGERSPSGSPTAMAGTWDTRVGTMELHIPKLREGGWNRPAAHEGPASSSRPTCFHPAGADQGPGCDGISRCRASASLDEVCGSFLGRLWTVVVLPHVWLDGLTQKVREGGRRTSAWWWRRGSMPKGSVRSGWT